jgi:alpha-beta hydrolase superfamily lysophospholipase
MTEPEREWWIERPGGSRLHVRTWAGAAPWGVVCVVHGLGDHAGRFAHVGRALSARGLAVHSLDLPGHGRSEGPRGHIRGWSEFHDSLAALIARVAGEGGPRPLGLLGHSMGALVALDWTLRNPTRVRALVLSAPPFELAMKPLVFKVWLARIAEKVVPALTQANQIPPSLLSHDPEVVRAHRADPLVHHRVSARLYIEYVRMRGKLFDRAGSLSVPTLVLQGGSDPVASAPTAVRFAERAPRGTVTMRLYPGLFHEVLNEYGGPAILEELTAWIERALRGAPEPPETRGPG